MVRHIDIQLRKLIVIHKMVQLLNSVFFPDVMFHRIMIIKRDYITESEHKIKGET